MASSDDRKPCFGFGSFCFRRRFLWSLRRHRRHSPPRYRRRFLGVSAARRLGEIAARVEKLDQSLQQEVDEVLQEAEAEGGREEEQRGRKEEEKERETTKKVFACLDHFHHLSGHRSFQATL